MITGGSPAASTPLRSVRKATECVSEDGIVCAISSSKPVDASRSSISKGLSLPVDEVTPSQISRSDRPKTTLRGHPMTAPSWSTMSSGTEMLRLSGRTTPSRYACRSLFRGCLTRHRSTSCASAACSAGVSPGTAGAENDTGVASMNFFALTGPSLSCPACAGSS